MSGILRHGSSRKKRGPTTVKAWFINNKCVGYRIVKRENRNFIIQQLIQNLKSHFKISICTFLVVKSSSYEGVMELEGGLCNAFLVFP